MSRFIERREEKGFTLIELLIAIVVVGVLTAVAIVGIAGLTDEGQSSACAATEDAAKAAQAVHYANALPNDTTPYPTTFNDMVNANPPQLELSGSATVINAGTAIQGDGWILTGVAGGDPAGSQPMTFSGCPA
jgi:prepilin-type N-terminal cleavage/methylation domain-containing protein